MLRGTKFTAEKSNSQVSVCVNFIIFLTDYHSAISGDRIGYPELDNQITQVVCSVQRQDNARE